MFIGFILVLVGFVFLLKNLGYLAAIDWGIIWPVVLIAFGLSIIVNRPYSHEWRLLRKMRREKQTNDENDEEKDFNIE